MCKSYRDKRCFKTIGEDGIKSLEFLIKVCYRKAKRAKSLEDIKSSEINRSRANDLESRLSARKKITN